MHKAITFSLVILTVVFLSVMAPVSADPGDAGMAVGFMSGLGVTPLTLQASVQMTGGSIPLWGDVLVAQPFMGAGVSTSTATVVTPLFKLVHLQQTPEFKIITEHFHVGFGAAAQDWDFDDVRWLLYVKLIVAEVTF